MNGPHRLSFPSWKTAVVFALLSALYFTDTLLRASLKAFWVDELLTVFLCRLPSFHATWAAVLHGCDFNPPLLYLFTRGSEWLFGEGLIATRLPAIMGFWIFGICLYVITSRRLGRLLGCLAALVPVFTLAHYYASEARPSALVLCCCGLMLVCWQRTQERSITRSGWSDPWLFGLSVSFLAALLSHVYAVFLIVPFLLVEGYRLLSRQRARLETCVALCLPLLLVAPLYLRLSRQLRSFDLRYELFHPQVRFEQSVLATYGPALIILLIAVGILAWQSSNPQREESPIRAASFSREELVLAFAFLLLPLLGIVAAKWNHGPYYDRYFVFTTAGFSLLVAQLTCSSRHHTRVATSCLIAMVLLLVGDSVLAARALLVGADIVQVEPASQFPFTASPSYPLARDYAFRDDKSGLDILVTDERNNLYLFYYAPPELRRRIVFAAPTASSFLLTSFRLLNQWANLNARTATYPEFFATHKDFLVYASNSGDNGSCRDCLQAFLDAGYTLRSVQHDIDSLLEHFSR